MCLLTFVPGGVMPDVDSLLNGAFVNDDGHGYAIVHDRELIIGHGMNAETMIDEFARLRSYYRDGPALFHSRFSTHGLVNTSNIHPFFVGGDERTVLAHNGVLPENVQPRKGDPRSDTRIAAEDFIPSMGPLHARKTRIRVKKWMTDYNKIVVLSVNPRYREQAYILNEEAGTWHNGIWYSNSGFRPYAVRYKGYGFGSATTVSRTTEVSTYKWDRCGECYAIMDYKDGECPFCGWCVDCEQGYDLCLCYKQYTKTSNCEPYEMDDSERVQLDDSIARWEQELLQGTEGDAA